jgi:hypothetical protein
MKSLEERVATVGVSSQEAHQIAKEDPREEQRQEFTKSNDSVKEIGGQYEPGPGYWK